MRASSKDTIGKIGETEVFAAFERLGWGVAANSRHDLGTDLWLSPRDARGQDLRLHLGAQVKSGRSWFSQDERAASGELLGWWFRDRDRRHIDAWLGHTVPHVLVLHDLETQTSYWVHVADDVVVPTGRGAKILVPVDSTVDEAHRDELVRVAATNKPGAAWEGSAWTGAATVPQQALMRHALIAPRLVAPHPNLGRLSKATPAQALALLVQARVSELDQDEPALLGGRVASKTAVWDRGLVAAMRRRVTAGDYQGLLDAAQSAPDAARRSVAAVASAATMLEDGLADDAITVLDAALAPDDADPVDHAWLTVQKARACAEVGRVEEARVLAADAQAIGVTHAEDVTATAVAAAAALLLFNTSGWEHQDLAGVIGAADTTTAWWRTQSVSQGLTALAERLFSAWSRDTPVRLPPREEANDQLLSAALTASFTGDHASWRHLTGLLGQADLLRLGRHANQEDVLAGLETLRLSGHSDGIKAAVRNFAEDGPAHAVTLTAARVALDHSTRTTGPADLTLLEAGGDLLDEQTADRTTRWLLAAVEAPAAWIERTNPTYLLPDRFLSTLAAVVPAAPLEAQQLAAERLSVLPAQTIQRMAHAWAWVAGALPKRAWTPETARRAAAAADTHAAQLRMQLLGAASDSDPTARQRLLDEAEAGSLDALQMLGDVRELPANVVQILVAKLASGVNNQIEEARKGAYGGYFHDQGHALALLDIWHPQLADWQPLLRLIQEPQAAGDHKRGALTVLAVLVDRIPEQVRPALLTAAQAAARDAPRPLPGLFGGTASAAATELTAALADRDTPPDPQSMVTLIAGDEEHRISAARAARRLQRPEDMGVLLVLAQDLHPGVRSAAAAGLAQLVADGLGGPIALAGLNQAAADPGRQAPTAVATTLARCCDHSPETAAVLGLLRIHASAAVRAAARDGDPRAR